MQGYSGGDSSGSEDEDMDSEDEEIDMGEVCVYALFVVTQQRSCSSP